MRKYRTAQEYLADWPRGVSGGKGGASKAEQQAADQQRSMENQLLHEQLHLQQGQINMVNPTLQSIISNGGLLPNEQGALTSLVMNQLPATFNNLQGQLNQNLQARGITGGAVGAGSGDVARQFGGLGAMEGRLQQEGLSNIQLEKQQGLRQALNTALGIGGIYGQNIGNFNSGALSALGSGVTAAHNADQAGTGLWGSILGGALGLGSSFLPGGQAAGALGLFGRGRSGGGGGGAGPSSIPFGSPPA